MQKTQANACYSDINVVELAPLDDSLIIEVEVEVEAEKIDLSLDDIFDDFFNEIDKLAEEVPSQKCESESDCLTLDDIFDDFFNEIDKLAEEDPSQKCDSESDCLTLDDIFDDFFNEIDKLAEETPLIEVAPKKERKRVKVKNIKSTSNTDEVLVDNVTRTFLYDPNTNVYEDWREGLLAHFNYKLKNFLPNEDAEDVVNAFLDHLVVKDKLKKHIKTAHKKFNWIKSKAFTQWIIQRRQKSAQDCLTRHRDKKARTEQEIKHIKNGVILKEHVKGRTLASVVYSQNEETGRMEETGDMWVSTESSPVEEQAERNELQEIVFEAFASSTEDESEAKRMYDVFVELHQKNFKNTKEWAESWGLEVSEVKHLKKKVKTTIRESKTLSDMYT